MRRQERSCGACSACCTENGVVEIGKAPRMQCPHESILRSDATREGCGCTIYSSRPRSCRVYECLWRLGEISDNRNKSLRPDRLGVIFERTATVNEAPAMMARELRPKALDQPAAVWIIDKERKNGAVVVLRRYEGGFEAATADGRVALQVI